MIKKHDRIKLTAPGPREGLFTCTNGSAFEIEFTTLGGTTAALATVAATAVRPVTGHEITHSRELTGR